jgi:hypothetical protein
MGVGRRNRGGGAGASSLLLSYILILLVLAGCTTTSPSVPFATEEVRREWQTGIDQWHSDNPEYTEYILRTGAGGPHRTESSARKAAIADARAAFRRSGNYEGPVEVLYTRTIQKVRGSRYFWLAVAVVGTNPRRGDVPAWLSAPVDAATISGVGVGLTAEEAREEARTSIVNQLVLDQAAEIPYRETALYLSEDNLFWVRLAVVDADQQHSLDLIRDRLGTVRSDADRSDSIVPTLRFLTQAYQEVIRSPWRSVATVEFNGNEVLLLQAIETTIQEYLNSMALYLSTATVTMGYSDNPEVFVELEMDSGSVRETVPLLIRNDKRFGTGTPFTYDGDRPNVLPVRSMSIPVGRSVWTVSLDGRAVGLDRVSQLSDEDVPHQKLIVERARPRIATVTASPESLSGEEISLMILEELSTQAEIVSAGPAEFTCAATLHVNDVYEYEGIHFAAGTMEVILTNETNGETVRYSKSGREGGLNERNARSRLRRLLWEELIQDRRFLHIDGIEK